jgi:fatty-acyl-CoA synthase
MAELMGVTRDDRILAHMPFFHVGGAFMSIVTALLTGCSIICLESFSAAGALALIEEHGCTVINGVPSHFIMMLTELEKRQTTLRSPRIGWIAGAMIPPEVVTAIRKYFGMNLVTMYGMTESTGVITSTRPDDPLDVLLQTVGTAISSDYEVRITSPATLAEAPRGEQGEIWMRGHRLTRGYYKMPEETAASLLPDGWFRTGDLGVMREDGRLRITGRLKDMFIVGGTNAYPAEIENVIGQLPAVNQVHVIGIPDERLGEVPMAFIERRAGHTLDAEEVIAFSRAKLANYKCPRFVEFVDTFPMTASGKIQKYKLRDQAITKLGLEELARRRLLEYQRD